MKEHLEARLQSLREVREKVQQDIAKALIILHQHDGAIAAYEEMLKRLDGGEPPKPIRVDGAGELTYTAP